LYQITFGSWLAGEKTPSSNDYINQLPAFHQPPCSVYFSGLYIGLRENGQKKQNCRVLNFFCNDSRINYFLGLTHAQVWFFCSQSKLCIFALAG